MIMFAKFAVVMLVSFVLTKGEEPHCSKYDFEEKVLEKLVRMEFNMEKSKLEMNDAIKANGDLKKSVEKNVDNVQQKLNDLNEKMTDIEAMKKKQNNEVNEKLREVSTVVDAELIRLKETSKPTTVVFKARSNAADTSITGGQTIVFPVSMINVGNGYDANTGIFTAPVNGSYMFTVALCAYNGKYIGFSIMVDETQYSLTLFHGDDNHTCHSADTVAVLTVGQKVWVNVIQNTSGVYHSSLHWNTFSGILINAVDIKTQ